MTPERGGGDRERTESDARTIPEDDDKGKTVVDTRGREIGMVEDVRGDTMYVAPDPSLTDSIRSKLGGGASDEDALPVSPEFVGRIEDDVVLDVERDEEFQEGAS